MGLYAIGTSTTLESNKASGEAIGGSHATGGKIAFDQNDGRLRGGREPTGGARIHRPACPEGGAGACAVRRGLVAVRIEPPAVELLRANRRAAGRAQEARRRARGRRRPLGRAGIRDVPARTEVPVPRAPSRLRQGALRRTGYFARGRGGAPEGRCRELGLFRRARRPVLLHRPRPGPTPMGRRWHVSADRNAAAPRRRAPQLPADGVVGVPQDRCADRVTPGRAHPLLWHVDRVRGRYSELRPYGPGAARRDDHVRRGSSGRQSPSTCQRSQRRGSHRRQPRVMRRRAHMRLQYWFNADGVVAAGYRDFVLWQGADDLCASASWSAIRETPTPLGLINEGATTT